MLELWFDFSCPYAYLASVRAPALAAAHGLALDWRPMLLGGVFRGIGAGDGPMASLPPSKAAYNTRDMARWAEVFDIPLVMPPQHPMRTVRALRVLLGVPHASWPRAIAELFAAYWQRGDDLTRDEPIAAALARADVPEAAIRDAIARADSDAIKDELRRRTDDAIALGMFGAPAWIIRRDDREPVLIWGQDRIAWVEAVLAGWDPDSGPPPGGPRTFGDGDGAGAAPAAPGVTLDIYCDAASPFSYLALTQLPALLASASASADDATVRLRPILLGALFRSIGTPIAPLLAFPLAKQRYIGLDMARWARWWGVPFAMPSKFPQRSLLAQRVTLLAGEHGFDAQLRVAVGLGRAMWAERRDLESADTVRGVVVEAGLPAELVARADEPASKTALVDATAAAEAAGVFGVPTFVVAHGARSALYWGQDRVELVARALAGWHPSHG